MTDADRRPDRLGLVPHRRHRDRGVRDRRRPGRRRLAQRSPACSRGGHALLEGTPGLGKTLLVRSLAAALGLEFGRIQFTPDLLPADVTGTHVLEEGPDGRRFVFRHGPALRATSSSPTRSTARRPRTQSALLEAMQEGAVTRRPRAARAPARRSACWRRRTRSRWRAPSPSPRPSSTASSPRSSSRPPDEAALVAILARATAIDRALPAAVLGPRVGRARRDGPSASRSRSPLLRHVARIVRATDPQGRGGDGVGPPQPAARRVAPGRRGDLPPRPRARAARRAAAT